MKSKLLSVAGIALLLGVALQADSRADTKFCNTVVGSTHGWGLLVSTVLLGPPGTTTGLFCFGDVWNAEADRQMLEREAVMSIEENQIYSPSWLGGYAEAKGFSTLQDAARDIIENGVRN